MKARYILYVTDDCPFYNAVRAELQRLNMNEEVDVEIRLKNADGAFLNCLFFRNLLFSSLDSVSYHSSQDRRRIKTK